MTNRTRLDSESQPGYMTDFELRTQLNRLKGTRSGFLLPPVTARALIQEVLDHRRHWDTQEEEETYDPVSQVHRVRLSEVTMKLAGLHGQAPDQPFEAWLINFLVDHVTLENELAVAQGFEDTAPEGWRRYGDTTVWRRIAGDFEWVIGAGPPIQVGRYRTNGAWVGHHRELVRSSVYRTMLAVDERIAEMGADDGC